MPAPVAFRPFRSKDTEDETEHSRAIDEVFSKTALKPEDNARVHASATAAFKYAAELEAKKNGGPRKRGPRPAELKGLPPARADLKALTVHVPPQVSKKLRAIAVEEDTTLQALIGEAIDLLMMERGLKPFGAR